MAQFDESLVNHRFADLGDVRLHYVEAGRGPLVVLLHGFPEFWYSWRNQIPALVAAGYRVVAPDMRGYNLSDKPQGVASYAANKLTGDVANLIRHLGEERACVVAHDWGGAVGWVFAAHYPAMTTRLAILNAPHPIAFRKLLRTREQFLKSWYIFTFQVPRLPELAMARNNYEPLRKMFRADLKDRRVLSDEDLERYITAFAQPGAATAAINYYRAALRPSIANGARRMREVSAPTLVVWGERDNYLSNALADQDPRWVPNARVERIPHATHWVQLDAANRVNELLVEFFEPVKTQHSVTNASTISPAHSESVSGSESS